MITSAVLLSIRKTYADWQLFADTCHYGQTRYINIPTAVEYID